MGDDFFDFRDRSTQGLVLCLLLLLWLMVCPLAQPQSVTLTGTLRASNGLPSSNYSIAFTPTQWAFIAGTGVQVNTTTYCATSTDGSVVGIINPLTASVVTPQYTGTLPAGNYFIEYTFYNGATETLASPESTAQLTATGELLVAAPITGVPATATGMKVYIGTTSGGETYQGSTTGSGTYTQSTALAAGSSPPGTNSTVCTQTANDAMWPTGTGYTVSVTDPSGNTLPGYPMVWQLLGPNSTINLSNGLPYYHGVVTYPVPILAIPINHANQSISGPLSMTGYNVVNVGKLGVGTGTPGWGVDAEGTGNNGRINALNGYMVNGSGGTNGQGLCSDGTALDQFCNFLTSGTLPTFYYQTVGSNGTAQTQRPTLNFSSRFGLSDSASPPETNVELANSGVTSGAYTLASVTVDQYGRVTAASSGVPPTGTVATGSASGCTFSSDGNGLFCGPITVTLNKTMPDTSYTAVCNYNLSNAIITTLSAQPAMQLNWSNASTTQITVYEGVNSGSSTGFGISSAYGVTVTCIAQEN